MNKKRKNNWIKVTIYSILIVFVSFFLLLSIDLLVKSFNPEKHNTNIIMSYNADDKVEYYITAFDTGYNDNLNLGMNQKYITSLIDDIKFNIKFNFYSSKLIEYDYEYSAVASLYANYEGNNIWTKVDDLIAIQNVHLDEDNSIELFKSFIVDYDTYNNLVKDLKEKLEIDINSYLSIKFNVKVKSKDLKDFIYVEEVIARMPMLEEMTSITLTHNGYSSDDITAPIEMDEYTCLLLKLMYLVGTIISFILELYLLYKLAKITSRDRFQYEINAVFKIYDDILVEVDEIPLHKQIGEIDVTNFQDLVDVSNKLCLPILYKKIGEDYYFFILTDKYFYSYIVKRRFFNKKNK